MRIEQISTELSLDSTRLVYWAWGVAAAALIVLILLYTAAPKSSTFMKGEVTSIFVILSCVALLTAFLGHAHMILPIWILIIFVVMYYLRGRVSSARTVAAPGPITP
jgi:hypothetical protein